MSDEFDKEAEREKLREKFARDEKKREHTQRMSELLLKGATMTNKHCEQCGDPIFRHDGREFCPTCNRPADADDGSGTAPEETSASTDASREAATTADATTAGMTMNDGSSTVNEADAEPTATGGPADESGPPEPAGMPQRRRQPTRTEGSVSEAVAGSESDREADVSDARASLTRTLTRFARAAEETNDPRRSREHLKAAREAAETLAALDR